MPSHAAASFALVAVVIAVSGCDARPQHAALPAGSDISPVLQLHAARTNAQGEQSSSRLGSGFVVSDAGHLVTAYHVIENFQRMLAAAPADEQLTLVALPAPIDGAGDGDDAPAHVESWPLTRVAEDPANDLALLKVSNGPEGASAGIGPLALSLSPPEPDTRVDLAGYPFGARTLRRRLGHLAGASALEELRGNGELGGDEGTIPSLEVPSWFEALDTGRFLLAKVETHAGDSGGPVSRTDSGDVIGLCSAILRLNRSQPTVAGTPGDDAAAPFTLVIPSGSIAALLEEQRVDWRRAD